MNLERIQRYKAELQVKSSKEWGDVLYRLALEAMQFANPPDGDPLRKEYELLRMKYSIAIQALEPYSLYETYTGGQSVQQLTLSAKVALDKIEKVNWLVSGSKGGEASTNSSPKT